jgi:hypothetical protein
MCQIGNRGAPYTAITVLYFVTASISGWTSTTLYIQLGGTKWASNALLTAGLFAFPFFVIFICINSVAVYHGSTSALPGRIIALIAVLWTLVTVPMVILGAVRAKNRVSYSSIHIHILYACRLTHSLLCFLPCTHIQ